MSGDLPSNSQIWLAVRNAAPPFNVIGFLAVAREVVEDYQTMPFTGLIVRDEQGTRLVTAPLSGIFHQDCEAGRVEVAIFSEDRPIEFWRIVGGFVEAKTE